MISFFISTATKKLIVAVFKDDNQLFYYNENNDNTLSERIMPIIDRAFSESKIKPNDIDSIYVVNGPGSFTGIRVGVTIAKVMAWTLRKRIVAISSLEMLASGSGNDNILIPLIDARRDYVYAGIYDSNLDLVSSERHMPLSELLTEVENKEVLFISEDEFPFEVSLPQYDIKKIIQKHKKDKSAIQHEVNPNYLKLTEAEEKYRKNNDN